MDDEPTSTVIGRIAEIEGALPDPELSQELTTAIFEDAADGLIIVDMDTRTIRFCNRRAEFIFGYHRTEIVGQPVEVLVPDPLRKQHQADTEAYAVDPRPRPMGLGRVLQGRHKTGRPVYAHIMLSPLSVPGSQYVLATIRPSQPGEERDEESAPPRIMAITTSPAGVNTGGSSSRPSSAWRPMSMSCTAWCRRLTGNSRSPRQQAWRGGRRSTRQ